MAQSVLSSLIGQNQSQSFSKPHIDLTYYTDLKYLKNVNSVVKLSSLKIWQVNKLKESVFHTHLRFSEIHKQVQVGSYPST